MIGLFPQNSRSDVAEGSHPLYASISFIVSRARREDLAVPIGETAKRLWEASMDSTITIADLEAELRRVSTLHGVRFDP